MVEFTGWRKPISMSGLGKAVAVYCADGLVFCAARWPLFHTKLRSSQAGDLRSAAFVC
jgi:hypothetical protein